MLWSFPMAARRVSSPVLAAQSPASQAAAHRAEPRRTEPSRTLQPGIATLAIRGGRSACPATGALISPIVQSTTYLHEAVGTHKGHTYSRASNPTVTALEDALASLESNPKSNPDSQAHTTAFATGMAAISALFLSVLKAGDHAILGSVLYGGTVRLVEQILRPLNINVTFVDTREARNVERAITRRTKLVFIETPANPTLILTDVAAIARITRAKKILLAVDNTFLTPVILRPLDLGADISVYSTTKYIEGHNVTVGGALTTADAALSDRFRLIRKTVGSIQAPFEAWLTLKGLKTLPLRLRQHCENAQQIAEFLEAHPAVSHVWYPGLKSFAQHDLALRQHAPSSKSNKPLHGGIIAFEVRGGLQAGTKLMNAVRLCSLAENLGATETLITHPVTMTHGAVPKAQRDATGITDGLIRLSAGLEDAADIIADLAQALEISQAPARTVTARTTTRTTRALTTTRRARTHTPPIPAVA
jgi:cystathionine beta-lyase/cystathionine gamma-synthase